MAIFKIISQGITVKPILVLLESTSSSCQSKFIYEITGNIGDVMTFSFTDDTSSGNYNYTSVASALSANTITVTVYVNNTATVETTQQTIIATNSTTSETDSETISRNSTGIVCT